MADYYRTLGVAKDASAEDIRRAFRKLAKAYHPDATGGDAQAEKKFIEINEAYETLGDPKKRRAYDQARQAPPFGEGRPFRYADPAFAQGTARWGALEDLDDMLRGFFGRGAAATADETPQDTLVRCEIPPWIAALGGRIEVPFGGRTFSVTIPPNARTGQKLRLRGQGRARAKGRAGDLVLELALQNPGSLTAEQRRLYERLAGSGRANA